LIARLAPERSPGRSLRDAGLSPQRWSAGPHAVFAPHSHTNAKRLFVLRGRIRFNDEWLEAPDGIRIPAGFEHSAVAGDDGVDCIEGFEET
jgi:hypothetical protein